MGLAGLEIGAATDRGRVRAHNEDAFDFFEPLPGSPEESKGTLFAVADGLGGHLAGEVASRVAVESLLAGYYTQDHPGLLAGLRAAFDIAHQAVRREAAADASRATMATTLVAAVVRGGELLVANVGDSRAYLVRPGNIKQITQDHSWVAELVAEGQLTAEEALSDPRRSVITRALGVGEEVAVDTFQERLSGGEGLVLCTDGLYHYVPADEMAQVAAQRSAQEAAEELVALANQRGGHDNITALVVKGL